MSIFTVLKWFGRSWVSRQIKSGLDHKLSPTGRQTNGAALIAAGTALKAGDTKTAADTITDILFSIR